MIWASQFHIKYIAKHRNLYSIIFSWTKVVRYIAWLDLTKIFSEWAWVGYYPWQQCSPIIPSSASWSSSVRTLSEQCILHWSGLDCPVQINQAQLPLPPHPLHRFPPPSTLAKNHPDHLQSYISWSTRFGIFQRLPADQILIFSLPLNFNQWISFCIHHHGPTVLNLDYNALFDSKYKRCHQSKNPMQELSDWPCLAMQKIGNGQIVYNCTVYMTRSL